VVETAAIVAIAVAVVWTALGRPGWSAKATAATPAAKAEVPLPGEPITLVGAEISGSQTAKTGLIIFSDFQCPFCAKFARDTMPTLMEQYVKTGNLLVAFRQLPLPIHNLAERVAATAVCAGKQGKFWSFHDEIFKAPRLEDGTSGSAAKAVGLDAKALETCLTTDGLASVKSDLDLADRLGVQGTPTFLLGSMLPDGRLKATERFSGALPIAEFQRRLNGAIALATK
jgi:protein-disulfide isomerase